MRVVLEGNAMLRTIDLWVRLSAADHAFPRHPVDPRQHDPSWC